MTLQIVQVDAELLANEQRDFNGGMMTQVDKTGGGKQSGYFAIVKLRGSM